MADTFLDLTAISTYLFFLGHTVDGAGDRIGMHKCEVQK